MTHPLFAAAYDRLLAPAERAGLAARRRSLLGHAAGTVLEVGGGTGLNLVHYPTDGRVESVTVLEPDAGMRRRLLNRMADAPVAVTIHETTLEESPLAPSSFDTVVTSLVLCSVPDLDAAVARIRDVVRDDGRVLFLEHVRVPGWRGVLQRASKPVWRRIAGGCCPDRDVVNAFRRNGFSVTDCDHFTIRFSLPHVSRGAAGVARPRPAGKDAA